MLVVFTEIQRLGLGGNTLTGVVFELAALIGLHDHTALDAQDLIFVDLSSVGTVGAGAGHFLSEQHGFDLTNDV